MHFLFGFFTHIWPSCTYNIHQIVQDTVRGCNETSITEKRSLEKIKANGLLLKSKRSENWEKLLQQKNGDCYKESVPYLSHNGSMVNGLKYLDHVCQNEHRSEGAVFITKKGYSVEGF